MAKEKVIKWDEPEKVGILRACRVKEVGAREAKDCVPGDIVTVAGQDKIELISRNIATFDLEEAKKKAAKK